MEKSNVGLSVLVNGKPIKEYQHKKKTYVEGRHGSEFTLRLTNNTSSRKLFVVSLDGLSIMDGKSASSDSNGYIIPAYSQEDIPGWKLDGDEAAKFFFTVKEKEESYAEQTGHGDANTGVIGLRVYNEYQYIRRPVLQPYVQPYLGPHWGDQTDGEPHRWAGSSTVNGGAMSANITSSITRGASSKMSKSVGEAVYAASAAPQDFIEQNAADELGAGFGDAVDFETTSVSFTRASVLAEGVLFYDTLRGLKARGVPIHKGKKVKIKKEANPFPGDNGCEPPKGWKPRRKTRRNRRKELTS